MQIINLGGNLSLSFDKNCRKINKLQSSLEGATLAIEEIRDFHGMIPYSVISYADNKINYITFYREEGMVYSMYFSPFDKLSWALLVTFLAGISTFRDLFVRFYLKFNLAPSTFLFFLGSIIDEGSTPVNSVVAGNLSFRLASIWWLLSAVVLSNGYISFLITGLNAPFPPTTFETLESLYCTNEKKDALTPIEGKVMASEFLNNIKGIVDNTTYPNITKTDMDYRSIMENFNYNNITFFRNFHKPHCFTFLSNKTQDGLVFNPMTYEIFNYALSRLYASYLPQRIEAQVHFCIQFITQYMRWYPKRLWTTQQLPVPTQFPLDRKTFTDFFNMHYFNITRQTVNQWAEDVITDCSNKAALFGEAYIIDVTKQKLERLYPQKNFYQGADSLPKQPLYLFFFTSRYSKVARLFQAVMEGGIFQVLLNDSIKVEVDNVMNVTKRIMDSDPDPFSKEEAKVKPQNLKSSLITVFILMGISLGLAAWLFLAEYVKLNFRRICMYVQFLMLKGLKNLKKMCSSFRVRLVKFFTIVLFFLRL